METLLKSLKEKINPKINILVVDDDESQLFVHREMLSSSVIYIETCSTLDQAKNIIKSSKNPWHCWVIDINMGINQCGLDLLDLRPNYPFAIVLSGMHSLKLGSEAVKKGVMSVFDKDPKKLDYLYDEVCKVASLGYVLDGKPTQYIGQFSLLKEKEISTGEEWAEHACLTLRQMGRICAMHSSLTPRHAIALYNTIYCLLSHEINASEGSGTAVSSLVSGRKSEFYASCIHSVIHGKMNAS